MNSRQFHLADILSVTTGFLFVNPANEYPIDGVYHIIDFMTGESLQTVALGRAMHECRPLLMEQLPFTHEISVEYLRGNEELTVWNAKLNELVEKYGEFHPVFPMGAEDHEVLDPAEDARRLGFKGEIIEIHIGDGIMTPLRTDIGISFEYAQRLIDGYDAKDVEIARLRGEVERLQGLVKDQAQALKRARRNNREFWNYVDWQEERRKERGE